MKAFPILLISFVIVTGGAAGAQTHLELRAWETSPDSPVPCRVHLKNERGEPLLAQAFPAWHDHFVFPGRATLPLAPGRYDYEVERGPEYRRLRGSISLSKHQTVPLDLRLERIVDLKTEGWWSGDLHIHRNPENVPLLARAEDLHFAPVITWWNAKNTWSGRDLPDPRWVRFANQGFSDLLAGEDEREGGALLYFHLPRPLPIQNAGREFPSPMRFLEEAHRSFPEVHADIEKPFWWDVPVWLASGMADTIGLANNHMCRGRMLENEAWGKPRDTERLPPPRGNGFWTQEIYYHILNAGLRIPPSAGSASGVLPNPVGYNRVYVRVDGELTPEAWWRALREGRSFVSNGPLLRAQANDRWPGEVFTLVRGETLDLTLTARLDTQDDVAGIEIIRNGEVARTVPWEQWRRTGSLGSLSFEESGWFLVRVVADREDTFRFASTAPWYVQVKDGPRRVSRGSVRFFLDWIDERMSRIRLDDADEQKAVLGYQREAREFWEKQLALANAP